MPTFNGWTILNPPSVPATPNSPVAAAPSQIEFSMVDAVAANDNPFTGQQQVVSWGTAWMEWGVTLPAMHITAAVQWFAWLMSLQGQTNIFQLGDPTHTSPFGTGAGSPVVNGGGQTGFTLSTRGFTGGGNVLQSGDWIQIGYRLYRVTANATGSGPTLAIWPQIRESPADGTAIAVTNTQGIWRLKESVRKCSVNEMRLYGFQFNIREAI